MTSTALSIEPGEVLARLDADGYVVVEDVIPRSMVRDLKARVEDRLASERAAPLDPGPSVVSVDQVADLDSRYFRTADDEAERLKNRIRRRQADEFDTPWPVPADDVCISFIHIPMLFDEGCSQRIFNLINKDVAFAPLVEHPLVLSVLEAELGRDLIVLDMSVNHVGAGTDVRVWHIDSPLTQIPEPLPNFTLSIQTVWMLDDFTVANGATHVVSGSNHTQRKPPASRDPPRRRGRARRARRLRCVLVVADLAPPRRQRHRSRAPADRPVRPLVDQAVRRSAHPDRRDPGGRLLAATALPARVQRQRARARLISERPHDAMTTSTATVTLAASPVAWGVDFADAPTNPPWEHVLDDIAASGVGALELGPVGYLPEDPATLQHALTSRGLASVGSFLFDDLHDPAQRDRLHLLAERVGAFVAAAGAGRGDGVFVIIDKPDAIRVATAGRSAAAPRLDDEQWAQLVERFDELAAIARRHGARPVAHPHAGGTSSSPTRSSASSPRPTSTCASTRATSPTPGSTRPNRSSGMANGSGTSTSRTSGRRCSPASMRSA